ncbi:MAG: hypothetical protein E7631_12550 [Ruminococcaceae bacterium]|nr:hypothetical protein [Oscillospiraceae bacterium]
MNGCGSTSESPESELQETEAVVSETEPETVDLYAELRGVDAGGKTVDMLLRGEFMYEFMAAEETGEAVNDTVYARNLVTEELLNISLTFKPVLGSVSKQSQFIGVFTDSILANDNSFDLVSCAASYMLALTAKGYFRNLLTTPELSIAAALCILEHTDAKDVNISALQKLLTKICKR